MNFAEVMANEADKKLTENGAVAYSKLNNPALELYSQLGALRPRPVEDIENKFEASYNYNRELTLKMLFMCGNIRGGLGERRTFRIGLRWFARNYPEDIRHNMDCIAHFNRFDSLFALRGTPCEYDMLRFISQTLSSDMKAMAEKKPVSLLAKWMPSENTSSAGTRELAQFLRKKLKMTTRSYRKVLSALRKYIKVTERDMSNNNWSNIDYNSVPSYAMKNYSNAFNRHDPNGFALYKEGLLYGKSRINASTLYPYDLVHQVMIGQGDKAITEAQWKALPNYVEGDNNFVVMADVSGSMRGRPMETSIGLAIYFAQRNHGDYHGKYMTFSRNPSFLNIEDSWSLYECVRQTMERGVGYNTNLEKAFMAILSSAVANNVRSSDMPKALIVVSDMEIDSYMNPYMRNNHCFNFIDEMKKRFTQFCYKMPKLILWNVEARNDTFLTKSEDVIFVSGQSASTFKQLCGTLEGKSAWDFMVETLNDPMYDCINL